MAKYTLGEHSIVDTDYLNTDSPDVSGLMGVVQRDIPATYCNGRCANNVTKRLGVLVEVHKYLKRCPICGSDRVIGSAITPKEYERMLDKGWKNK